MEFQVRTPKGEQRWRVWARENGDARLEGLSEKERGRGVMVQGDDMWLIAPGAKRPLKVSPQQRLLGPASAGDLARTRFREDYAVDALAPEGEGWALELRARRPGQSYPKARLHLAREGAPRSAEFFYASGKVARTVRFQGGATAHGRAVLQAMEIEDPKGGTLRIQFSHWSPGTAPEGMFELPASK